jgi:toxin-antitoxin system PIN domain toxin
VPGSLYDSNLWVALTFSSHPHHALAQSAFAGASLGVPACFCRATQQSFLRLAVTPALLKIYRPGNFTNADALRQLDSFSQRPEVIFLDEPHGLETLWHQLAAITTASPKVWMDAYLAAFAIGHDVEFVTLDGDFKSFEKHGLKVKILANSGIAPDASFG